MTATTLYSFGGFPVNMTLKKQLAVAALMLLGSQVHAANLIFDFTGDGSWSTFSGFGYISSKTYLTDVATGGDAPEFTISVGDVVSGTVTLPNSVTVGASTDFSFVDLFWGGNFTSNGAITSIDTFVFYDKGVQVTLPASLNPLNGSIGSEGIGVFSSTATPAFTFDEIKYSQVVTSLSQGGWVSSLTVLAGTANLSFDFVPPTSTVPEPASVALLLAGLGAIGIAGRRRGRLTV